MFVGLESLYKPDGFPSFELLSYILDSDLANVRKVLKDESIDQSGFLACGDLKEIFSLKNFRQTEVVRVGGEKSDNSGSAQSQNVYYEGVASERQVDPE